MMQSDTEPKFCKDCKHYEPAGAVYLFCVGGGWPEFCRHPKNMSEPELVRGTRRRLATPEDLRKPEASCGPDGAMFEAKPPEPPPEPEPSKIGSWQIVKIDPPKRGFWDFLRF